MSGCESSSQSRFRFWLAIGLLCLICLAAAASVQPGITWDEPTYAAAGYCYCLWFANLSADSLGRGAIKDSWEPNHEHPPAAKLAYGASAALATALGLPQFLAARLAAAAGFAALAGLVCLFVSLHFGRPAGVLAAAALALMPRVFGHGHLAALDVPAALAIFAATMVFADVHARKSTAAVAGLLWGVALLTKINAVFLPVVLVPWALWCFGRRAVLPCVIFLAIGGATFLGGWPWLWHDTVSRVQEYAVNKAERLGAQNRPTGTTSVPVYYLGQIYRDNPAPWHYPFVMILVTVPVGLLVFAGIGIPAALRRKPSASRDDKGSGTRTIGALILSSALMPLLVQALPMVPKYDGVRLFMPAFPFVACLAGIGAAWTWRRFRAGKTVVLAVLAVYAAALAWTHPYELSYYNEAVAGAWGAHKLGFETTYWGDTVNSEVIGFVNEHCPDGSVIDVRPRYIDFLPGMKETISFAARRPGSRPPDFLIVFPRQGYLGETDMRLLRERNPLRQWTYLGVPQCLLFDMRRQPAG